MIYAVKLKFLKVLSGNNNKNLYYKTSIKILFTINLLLQRI